MTTSVRLDHDNPDGWDPLTTGEAVTPDAVGTREVAPAAGVAPGGDRRHAMVSVSRATTGSRGDDREHHRRDRRLAEQP
jgi:hypothetical protein